MIEVRRKSPKNLAKDRTFLFENEFIIYINDPKLQIFNNIIVNQHLYFVNPSYAQKRIDKQGFLNLSIINFIKLILRNRIGSKIEAVIITDLWTQGYFHWMLDALPRLILFNKPEITIFLPIELKNFEFVQMSLRLLGFDNFTFLNQHEYKFIKKLNFPYQLAPTGNYNEEIIKELRNRFLANITSKKRNKKIYISRSKASRRKISNEILIIPILLKYGIEVIHCEDLTFKEQVELFSETKLLISNHGAGLSNMLFLERNSRVIEIRLHDDSLNNCYFSLASALDIDYYYFESENVNSEVKDAHLNDIYIDSAKFKLFLDNFFCNEI
jgi:capsular polysaccharide biosynthesis protein